MKWCFAQNPQVYLESGKRKIIFMFGQESDMYTIDTVRKVPGGFDYTVIENSGNKKQYSFRWITKGKTGK